VTDSTTKQRATARLREAKPTKGYGGSGLVYFDGGWPGPIPLPPGQKKPPPEGYTGKAAPYPDRTQVQEWCAKNPDGNLALRLHDGVIAVDVDGYHGKGGLATVAAFEEAAGCAFPATWTSTSRSDGSAQRFYRVPTGRSWPSGLPGSGVELIHPGHRYSVVYPSVHPDTGETYRWRDPGGALSLVVPSPKDLAELPTALVDALTATAPQPTELASEGAAITLLDGLPDGPMSADVKRVLAAALEELPGSRHETARRYVNLLIRKGEHGEPGVRDALGELRAAFVALVVDRESVRDAEREFDSLVSSGARLIAGDRTSERDLEGLRLAAESLAPGGWWFEFTAAHTARSVDEEEFWLARPVLLNLRQFARSRMVSPWAMFGVALARALTTVPPQVVLPATVGSHASLNTFVALVGTSSGGKSAAESAARDALVTAQKVHTANVGSGEGLIKVYAYRQKASEPQCGVRSSVLLVADEVDNLTTQGARSGSTLMPTLRSAWSGKDLGFAYADPTKTICLMPHRYRLNLVVGVQPGRARPLLEDSDAGTPQRFLWLPTTDPDSPDDLPETPEPWQLPPWPTAHISKDIVKFGSLGEAALLDVPVDARELHEIALPDDAVRETRRIRQGTLRSNGTGLDGRANLARLKVAAGLMVLDGRVDKITDEDWELAHTVMYVSDRTRAEVQRTLGSKAHDENVQRGRAEGVRSASADETADEHRIQRVVKLIPKHLAETETGAMSRKAGRARLAAGVREFYDEAVDRLVAAGVVEKIDGVQGSFTVSLVKK